MANYILLERITVGAAGASSVTFANIPQTGYTDLKIVASMRVSDAGPVDTNIKFNGLDTNKTILYMRGNGASAGSGTYSYTIGATNGSASTANTFTSSEIYIPNYAGSTNKSFSVETAQETNGTTAYATLIAGLWASTAAITSLSLVANFVQYSTFSLYALAAVGTTPVVNPKALGGDIIQTDGTYWYHAFLSSGTFTPKTPISCDILQVAGGGGGGVRVAGGGGAGGVLAFTSQYLTASANTVIVGAGGAAVTSTGATGLAGNSGTNSQFASLTASIGGGYGAGNVSSGSAISGGNGGSGGGAVGWNFATTQAGGTSTSGQGNNGGQYYSASAAGREGGGGGGAGSAGSQGYWSGSAQIGGNGGSGINTYTNATWLSTALSTTGLGVSGYIAGGGGGAGPTTAGLGGSGGGGNSGQNAGGTNGTPNTGSGGGGGVNDNPPYTGGGGKGGSGLVIVRYTV